MPGQHALLSASAASRWLACPPSARLCAKLEGIFGEQSSPYAAEGTKAHSLAELKLRHAIGEINDFSFKEQVKALGEISRQMERATNQYMDIVLGKLYAAQAIDPAAKLLLEQRLDFSPWVPSGFGTGDAIIVSTHTLEVIDYKNGTGVAVSAVNNPQARLYGLGAYNAFGVIYEFTHVRMTIVQPNIDSVTEETMTTDELLEWGESIKPTAELAWYGKGEFNPSDKACRFCRARALCAARAAAAMRGFTSGFATPGLIDDSEIPGILEVADIAEAWIKDVRAYARNQAIQGHQWPGYKLVRGRKGNRVWTDEEAVMEQLTRAGLSEEQYLNRELRAPGDIEKEMGKQAFDAIVKRYITQPEGALNLVPEDDKRVEYSSADATFADMATNE